MAAKNITLPDSVCKEIVQKTGAQTIDISNTLQELWSGYGSIVQLRLGGCSIQSAILKLIEPPVEQSHHPRGWNTSASHSRKLKSYQVETAWYQHYASLCGSKCKVPSVIHVGNTEARQWILMEDLTTDYPRRAAGLSVSQASVCLRWLAAFHATFLHKRPDNLWPIGTYWHLATRSDELASMPNSALKKAASALDTKLNSSEFQSFVHGDAKVANFCFSHDLRSAATVDFQYVGAGVGIKDVAYFLGSCLAENEIERHEQALLAVYFDALRLEIASRHDENLAEQVVADWSALYAIAWTDFYRFLEGWMPEHKKINSYTKKLAVQALNQLEKGH